MSVNSLLHLISSLAGSRLHPSSFQSPLCPPNSCLTYFQLLAISILSHQSRQHISYNKQQLTASLGLAASLWCDPPGSVLPVSALLSEEITALLCHKDLDGLSKTVAIKPLAQECKRNETRYLGGTPQFALFSFVVQALN